ncbi:potassium channel family protein [Angustibacter luteus]
MGTLAALILVSVLYAVLPWRTMQPSNGFLVAFAFTFGLIAAGALVLWQVTRYRSGRGRGAAQLRGLATAMWIAVLFFSGTYYSLAVNDPGQMSGSLHTRLDALYFTMSTVSTVGFGDITASGQAARAIVCLNIAFNLVVLALAVTTIRELHRHRA